MARDVQTYEGAPEERSAETTEIGTPRGTWAILLGYAAVLIGLWLYGYIELLVRS